MADSGRIFTTERPLPVQNARTPPSAYILEIAPKIAWRPRAGACEESVVPPSSGGRVIRKIFNLSNGAVHVRETSRNNEHLMKKRERAHTSSSNSTGQKELDGH